MKIDVAVITVAGKGTRLRPATQVIPKALLPLVNVPALQLVVEEALEIAERRLDIGNPRDYAEAAAAFARERLGMVLEPGG